MVGVQRRGGDGDFSTSRAKRKLFCPALEPLQRGLGLIQPITRIPLWTNDYWKGVGVRVCRQPVAGVVEEGQQQADQIHMVRVSNKNGNDAVFSLKHGRKTNFKKAEKQIKIDICFHQFKKKEILFDLMKCPF